MDLLTYLLIATIFTLPAGEVLRYQLGNGIAFTLMDLFVGITASVFLFKNKNRNIYLFTLPFITAILFSLAINFANLTSDQLLISLLYPIRWLLYLQLFFAAIKVKNKKVITYALFLSGLVTVGLGYVQLALYPNLRNLFYLGWDDHLYRMFATFLDPNFTGALFVLFFIFSLGLFFNSKTNQKYLFLTVSFFTLIAAFLTYSRSAMIMLAVSSFCFLYLQKKTKLFLWVIGLIIVFYAISSSHFYLENINPFRIVSTEARLQSAKIALDIFGKNPLLGVGFNAYRYAQIHYGYRSGPVALVSHADASTDNSWLFVLATTGIVGFIAFIYFWKSLVMSLFSSLKKSSTQGKTYVIIALSSLVGIFVDSLFINSLFFPYIMVWLWIILGIALS